MNWYSIYRSHGGSEQAPTPPANHIFAVPEKIQYEITFPAVEGYVDPGITRLSVNWELVGKIVLDPATVPDSALMRGLATHDGALAAYGPGAPELVSLEAWRTGTRVQQVAFMLAREMTLAWVKDRGGSGIPTHTLFPQLLTTVNRFLTEKVECKGNRKVQDVAISPYFGQALGSLLDAVTAVDESGASREKPIVTGIRSTKWVDFHTGKDIAPVKKCHLNAGVFDTKLAEQQAAFIFDTHKRVDRWVKNERLGFVIPYRREGIQRRYFPDFIVELTDGEKLVIETKGRDAPDVEIKAVAARRWCAAVNNDGRFGRWTYYLMWDAGDLPARLRDHPSSAINSTIATVGM